MINIIRIQCGLSSFFDRTWCWDAHVVITGLANRTCCAWGLPVSADDKKTLILICLCTENLRGMTWWSTLENNSGFAFTVNGWVQSYGSRCVKPLAIYGDVIHPKPTIVFWFKLAQSITARPMKGILTGPVKIELVFRYKSSTKIWNLHANCLGHQRWGGRSGSG